MRVILMAPPGGGKGTQARRLSRKHDIPHVETGKILRRAVEEETAVGRKAKKYMDSGDLVPDTIMIDIIKERLAEPDCEKGFVMDGFPRTAAQAEALSELFAEQDISLDGVIFLEVSDEEIFSRLSRRRVCENCAETYHLDANPPAEENTCDRCGGELKRRSDDQPEAIKHRLDEYRDKTKPVLEYYRNRDLLVEVDGEQQIDAITREINNILAG
ncbi:MAG: adenylate kinase [bacterium]